MLKVNALLDSMATHAAGGKTIVFVNQKVSELAPNERLRVRSRRQSKTRAEHAPPGVNARFAGRWVRPVIVQARADEVCDLVGATHATGVLHGDVSQNMRDRALQQFRCVA